MQNYKLFFSLHTGFCLDEPLASAVPRGKWLGRTRVALTSQANHGFLRGIFPHHRHWLYLFWALLQLLRSLSCDCFNPAPLWSVTQPQGSIPGAARRTTARRQWLSHSHRVSLLKSTVRTTGLTVVSNCVSGLRVVHVKAAEAMSLACEVSLKHIHPD
jgi:hypothetical protein